MLLAAEKTMCAVVKKQDFDEYSQVYFIVYLTQHLDKKACGFHIDITVVVGVVSGMLLFDQRKDCRDRATSKLPHSPKWVSARVLRSKDRMENLKTITQQTNTLIFGLFVG